MPDIEVIRLVVAAGAMGISLALVYGVYKMLKVEQEKEKPRQSILVAIYVFMVFALLMTPLAILIEHLREQSAYTKLVEQLDNLSKNDNFTVNLNGDPSDPSFTVNDSTTILLSKKLPKGYFKENERKFELSECKDTIFVKTMAGTYLGHCKIGDIEETIQLGEIDALPEDFLYTSISRGNLSEAVEFTVAEDPELAIKYLLKILRDTSNSKTLRRKACKGLSQEEICKELDLPDYELLIQFLNSGKREAPYNFYELAQVYYHRSRHSGDKRTVAQKDSDRRQHIAHLKIYASSYEGSTTLKDTINHPIEWDWYEEALAVR